MSFVTDPGTNEVISNDDDLEDQQKDTPASEKSSEPNVTEVQNKVIATRDNAIQEHHVDPNNTYNGNNSEVTTHKKTFNEKFNLADIPQEVINEILIGESQLHLKKTPFCNFINYHFRSHPFSSCCINNKHHI